MTLWDIFVAATLGIVEGLTEFIPVSSTGHLILAGEFLGFHDRYPAGFTEFFEVAIQVGAIAAVCIVYRERLRKVLVGMWSDRSEQRFIGAILLGSFPALALGYLLHSRLKEFFNPTAVAWSLAVGGIAFLAIEWWNMRRKPRYEDSNTLPLQICFAIGCLQCFALIPGVSRSGATILGALLVGVSRKAATEYSFFLAVVTLSAAAGYISLNYAKDIHHGIEALPDGALTVFLVGLVFSFLSGYAVVVWLIRYVSSHDFIPFAVYRLIAGILMLTLFTGVLERNAEREREAKAAKTELENKRKADAGTGSPVANPPALPAGAASGGVK